jgi:hypothetical protein
MKAGVIKHLSIGYDSVKWDIKDGVRHLKEIKLYEIGLVPGNLAADDQALVLSVKTEFENRLTQVEEDIKEGYILPKADLTRIQKAITALQELMEGKQKKTLEAASKALPIQGAEQITPEDKEAAELESIVSGLTAENDGFNIKEAEARIDAILAGFKI